MPSPRRFELDEAVTRPGTYYHPSTDMLIVVDDGASLDTDIFDDTAGEDAEWVLLAEEVPIDETARDEVIERFEARYHPGASGAVLAEEDDEDVVDSIEPDPDPEGLDHPPRREDDDY
jgi:hypothetical protein